MIRTLSKTTLKMLKNLKPSKLLAKHYFAVTQHSYKTKVFHLLSLSETHIFLIVVIPLLSATIFSTLSLSTFSKVSSCFGLSTLAGTSASNLIAAIQIVVKILINIKNKLRT